MPQQRAAGSFVPFGGTHSHVSHIVRLRPSPEVGAVLQDERRNPGYLAAARLRELVTTRCVDKATGAQVSSIKSLRLPAVFGRCSSCGCRPPWSVVEPVTALLSRPPH